MKRANGTGSITKLPGKRRKPWIVKVSERGADGIISQRSLGTFARKADAQAFLEAYNTDRGRGVVAPDPGAVTVTLGELWEMWSVRELPGVGAGARRVYISSWKRALEKHADKKIRDMRADDWQAIIDADTKTGVAPATTGKVKQLMSALSRYALERDYINKDYTAFVKLPEMKAVVEKGRLTDAQVEQIADIAATGDRWAEVALVLCYTGMRASELLGLHTSAYSPECGGYVKGGLKTDAGRDRVVPIHPRIDPIVQRWRKEGSEYLVHDEAGKAITYKRLSSHFSTVAQQVGAEKATPHWARYTFASMAEEAHVEELAKKWIMGHSTSADITHHYTKLSIEYLCAEMRKIKDG